MWLEVGGVELQFSAEEEDTNSIVLEVTVSSCGGSQGLDPAVALAEIVRPQSPLLKEYAPELLNKPGLSTFVDQLRQYMARDTEPRVKKTVAFLVDHSETLTLP